MSKLKIAIQKSGRLNEDSLKLLAACGINIDNGIDQLKVTATNFPLEVFFLRNSDIPQYLEDGVVDIAILGENILIEEEKTLKIEAQLGFSKCKLSIATPKGVNYNSIKDLEGKKIATSYPNTLKSYLAKNVEQRGAGEILFTSMDNDGTKNGFANEALARLTKLVNIPIIASGGAGNIQHFIDCFKESNADATLAASVFHFKEIEIKKLKEELRKNNIPVRI